MSNTAKYQNDAIKRIMGKNISSMDTNTAHFTVDDKCTSIYHWRKNSDVQFDLSFVESVHDHFLKYGKCSDKQISALDKIISKFSIDVDKWCL